MKLKRVICSAVLSISFGTILVKREVMLHNNNNMPLTFSTLPPLVHGRRHFTAREVQKLAINPDSVIASDIISIWHNVTSSNICIRLRGGARCPRPSLVGRLSGKTIAMLEWSEVKQYSSSDTMHCGSYSNAWIDSGIYFVELMIIHCNGFGVMALDEMNWEDWLAYNYTGECLEDIFHNSLTMNTTYVWVPHDYNGVGDLAKGHWVLKDTHTANDRNYVPPPWYSRRQPKNCIGNLTERCTVPMDNSHIDRYEFKWNKHELLLSERLEHLKANIELKQKEMADNYLKQVEDHKIVSNVAKSLNFSLVCLLGDSHSWLMLKSLYEFGHQFLYSRVRWTDPDGILETIHTYYHDYKCTSFVIGVGAWSIGAWPPALEAQYSKGGPVLFKQFYDDIFTIASNTSIYGLRNDMQIYLRNVYHIPLIDRTSMCGVKEEKTAKDWRTHTAIDGYNYLIKRVVDEV